MSLLQRTLHSSCHLEGMCWLSSPPSPFDLFLGALWGRMVETIFGVLIWILELPLATKGRRWDVLLGELLHTGKT